MKLFEKATPVWACGMAEDKNRTLLFETELPTLQGYRLYLSAYTFYRLHINGMFVSFGPARTAEGYARVDVIDLTPYHRDGVNTVSVTVAGYRCRSLATARMPSFFCAEITDADGQVVLASGTAHDFVCRLCSERIQCVERYSMQRHFGEVWDFRNTEAPVLITEAAPRPVFLDRVVPYPAYRDILLTEAVNRGTLQENHDPTLRENRYSFPASAYWGVFAEDEIAFRPYQWTVHRTLVPGDGACTLPLTLQAGAYAVFDFGILHTGFLRLGGVADTDCEIVVGYSEYSEKGTFSFTSINAQNVLSCTYGAGQRIDFLSFEPYTVQCAVVMVKSGTLMLSDFGVKTYEHAMEGAYRPVLDDPVLQSVYDAALRTFAHNAVDLYTDCPSRERAGWLCDSYFTGHVEHFLFGHCPVEDAFLENYRLFRSHPVIPQGMLPMCYPADTGHLDDQPYIPQWCMWYVLEVKDYLTERNPRVDRALFYDSVMGIVRFLSNYENSDGLLEDLPGWNFVEWSDANKWVKNVNYPTNFLYAEVLRCVSALWGDASFAEKAAHIAQTAARQSFDGTLFVDNAIRDAQGQLILTGNVSEAGQYYALLFGHIDLDAPMYAALKDKVLTGFAEMQATETHRFVPVNAFIGLYLRIKALLMLQQYQLLLDELEGFFGGMVEKTGTLWEYRQQNGSYDHGFASYAAYAIVMALKGRNQCK